MKMDTATVRFFLVFWAVVLLLGLFVSFVDADAHYYAGCKKAPCKRHVVKPYKPMFESIARCESGGTMNPRIHNPSGTYHGLLQFDLRSWSGAGGTGDPHTHTKLDQFYRGVVWLHRNGRGSWPNC